MSELKRKTISMRADVPFSLFFLKLLLVYSQNYRSTFVDIYRPWPVALVVLPVKMFITTNELAFATQFMSPMSTWLDNCKCKSKIDNSSLNLTTIQVHDSCRDGTVHFLQGTVNLSSVKKLIIWGCLCFPVKCIFVMHDVSKDLIPSNLKDVFLPTAKVLSYMHNTRSSASKNFLIKISRFEIKRKSFSRVGARLWNELLTKLRMQPKIKFKKKIRWILFNILESEDNHIDVETLISTKT